MGRVSALPFDQVSGIGMMPVQTGSEPAHVSFSEERIGG